jgi:hypothetical protein
MVLSNLFKFKPVICRVSWANARPSGKQVRYRKNSEIKSKQAQEALDAAQLHFSFIAKQVSR